MSKTRNRNHRLYGLLAVMLGFILTLPGLAAPVETRPANTDYEPAFEAQTRAPGIETQTPYEVMILSENLRSPWAVTQLLDGRLIITQKDGTMRIYDHQKGLSGDIRGITGVWDRGQGGLLDIAPAPDFETSRMLYVTMAEARQGGSVTALGRGRLSRDESRVENFEILWRADPPFNTNAHYGSRLVFDDQGFLFVSTGERQSSQTRPKAGQLDSAYGKIIRLTGDGRPAPGNPFEEDSGALDEIWSLGHRNVQGMAIHPQTGELWVAEMGPRGGDELNLILPGKNYGWPVVSYGIEYSGSPVGQGITQAPGLEQPVYYWDPVLAPSGMDFYSGNVIPEWQNNLFVGGLAGSHISRLRIKDSRVTGEERLLEGEGQRFRDIAYGEEGYLYAVTDQGRLYRIGP